MKLETAQEPDYYQTLQVHPSADFNLIERAYWYLAHKYHRQAASDPLARASLERLNEAMSVIASRASDGSAPTRMAVAGTGSTPGILLKALQNTALDVWWSLLIIAILALGVSLYDYWVGIQGLSEHLAEWRRTIIVVTSASLAGLLIFAAVAVVFPLLARRRSARIRTSKDYYALLHLDHSAEPELAQIAYDCLKQQYTSLQSNNPWAARALQEIHEAFAVIGNPISRAEYDARHMPGSQTLAETQEPSDTSVTVFEAEASRAEASPGPTPIPAEEAPSYRTEPAEDRHGTDQATRPSAASDESMSLAHRLRGIAAFLLSVGQSVRIFPASVRSAWESGAARAIARIVGKTFLMFISTLAAAIVGALLFLHRLLAFLAPGAGRALATGFGAGQGLVHRVSEWSGWRRRPIPSSGGPTTDHGAFPSPPMLERLRLGRISQPFSASEERPIAAAVAQTVRSNVADPAARLVVVEGPTTGQTFLLGRDSPVTLGSDPACDILLSDDGGLIAPQQVRIWPRQDKFMFHLLSPEVPAKVQGKPFVWLVLEHGDLIEIGRYVLRFETVPLMGG